MNELKIEVPIWGNIGMVSLEFSDGGGDWETDLSENGFEKTHEGNENLIDQRYEETGFSVTIYFNKKSHFHYIELWGPSTSLLRFITRNETEKMECILAFSKIIYNFIKITESCERQQN